MLIEITGTIKRVEDTIQVSDKFKKRTVVLSIVDGDYTQSVGVEFTQDKVSTLDGFKKDEQVLVHANLQGRDWESPQGEVKNFVSLRGWKIGYTGSHADAIEGQSFEEQVHASKDPEDDLPF